MSFLDDVRELIPLIKLSDAVIAMVPVVMGVLGVWVSLRPPRERHHWPWVAVFVLLGCLASVTGLYQTATGRRDSNRDRIRADKQIDGLTAQLGDIARLLQQNTNKDHAPVLVSKAADKPDIQLSLTGAKAVTVKIENPSRRVVYMPKYQAMLWNLDSAGDLLDPLPVRVQMGDFIRPNERWGPNSMMGLPDVQKRVKEGDRVFGLIVITCPDCVATRTYIAFMRQGLGGWYSEGIPTETQGVPLPDLIRALAINDSPLKKWIPEERRKLIQ